MMRISLYIFIAVVVLSTGACKSTKKIQTAISKKDTSKVVLIKNGFDSAGFIRNVYHQVMNNRINYQTFSGKVKVSYRGGDGTSNDVTAFIRMQRDSIIWISFNALLGIEAFRVRITPDSVKVLDKLRKVVQFRSLNYLQEVTGLPINFSMLQDLIVGNPIFMDSNIVSFKKEESVISLTIIGNIFRHFISVNNNDYLVQNSKLDDLEFGRSRTAVLIYDDYENQGNIRFSTHRKISVAEKSTLDITLDYKQFNFNENLYYPFPIPKNYKRD